MTAPPRSPPDHNAALAQYRRRAGVYDLELALFEPVRRQAIARLALRAGETVLDVGCGTGLSLPLLRRELGAAGRIVGIEQCPEMIAKARARVTQHRWRNVELINASAEERRKHESFVARMVDKGYTEKQVRLLCEWYLRVRKSQ